MTTLTQRPLSAVIARLTLVLGIGALLGGCQENTGPTPPDAETIAKLTITARPGDPTIAPTVGRSELGLATIRDGFMYVPASYNPGTAAPLLVLLHGAGGADDIWRTASMEALAEAHGMIMLAIESRYTTWDGVQLGRYDVDVEFLNSALLHVFARVKVDSTRTAIGGFSDGASEALGIGVANAALFRKIIAFTPSMLNLPFARGAPDVFLSHGLSDDVVPFRNSSNGIVPILRANGMVVEFLPFEGGHAIPSQAETAAFNWLTGVTGD